MSNRSMRTCVVCAAVSLLGAPIHGQAPNQPPDVAGFRVGLSIQEAYAQLKGYTAVRGSIRAGERDVPELSEKPLPHALQLGDAEGGTSEVIQLDMALPPGPRWYGG